MSKEAITVLRETIGHIELEWEIQNFFDLSYKSRHHVESSTFLLGNASWRLWIFPNGDRELSQGCISLFLCRINETGEHNVSFSFALKAEGSTIKKLEYQVLYNKERLSMGSPIFVKRSALSHLLQCESWNGAVTVVFSGRLDDLFQDATCQTSRPEGVENLSRNFKELCLSGCRTNVKLKVKGQEFHAHTSILGARSPVFDAMFDSEMTEKNSGVVDIPDLDPESFLDFLLFMYTGKFDVLTPKNALDLYKASDKYNVNDIKEECSLRLASWLTLDNILDVVILASTHEETDLLNIATKYFIKNAKDIFEKEKWKIFMKEKTLLANELLKNLASK